FWHVTQAGVIDKIERVVLERQTTSIAQKIAASPLCGGRLLVVFFVSDAPPVHPDAGKPFEGQSVRGTAVQQTIRRRPAPDGANEVGRIVLAEIFPERLLVRSFPVVQIGVLAGDTVM